MWFDRSTGENSEVSSWAGIKEWPSDAGDCEVAPLDSNNIRLLDNVHPYKWKNPTPAKK